VTRFRLRKRKGIATPEFHFTPGNADSQLSNSRNLSELFIPTHNKTLSVAAMRVTYPDRLPFGINRYDTAQTPTDFTEIIGDNFPRLH
jgi:hypothetical protein